MPPPPPAASPFVPPPPSNNQRKEDLQNLIRAWYKENQIEPRGGVEALIEKYDAFAGQLYLRIVRKYREEIAETGIDWPFSPICPGRIEEGCPANMECELAVAAAGLGKSPDQKEAFVGIVEPASSSKTSGSLTPRPENRREYRTLKIRRLCACLQE